MEKTGFKYEFITGYRKSSQLLLLTEERQIFKRKNVYADFTRYICYINNCNVTVSLKKDGTCGPLSLECQHKHADPEDLIKKFQLIKNVKSECEKKQAGKRKGVREIFDEECRKDVELASSVCFPKMKRQLHRIRNSGMPKNPNTSQDLKLMFAEDDFFSEYGNSKHDADKPFYRETIIEDDFAYSVFISPTILDIIRKMPNDRRYLIDGTFRTVWYCGYKQLLVIHYHYIDNTFPFIYILMTKKSRAAYKHMFQFIDSNIFEFQASIFYADHEMALWESLECVFPNASLKACWFHYCQALRRHSLKIKSFAKIVKEDEECNKWYRKFLILPLVNPEQIDEMFLALKNDLLEFSNNHRECLNSFVKYFEEQWMTKITPSGFSMHLEQEKTTSYLEGFNFKLSKKLDKHGRFFKFLECIRDEDFSHSVSLTQSSAAGLNVLAKKPIPQMDKDDKIFQVTQWLSKGQISLSDFFNIAINEENNILKTYDPEEDDYVEQDMSDGEDTKDLGLLCSQATEEDDYGEQDMADAEDTKDSELLSSQATEVLKCIICTSQARDTLLQPCKHFKICSSCYAKLEIKSKKNNSPLLCPYCRKIVESQLEIFQ